MLTNGHTGTTGGLETHISGTRIAQLERTAGTDTEAAGLSKLETRTGATKTLVVLLLGAADPPGKGTASETPETRRDIAGAWATARGRATETGPETRYVEVGGGRDVGSSKTQRRLGGIGEIGKVLAGGTVGEVPREAPGATRPSRAQSTTSRRRAVASAQGQ